MLAAVYYGPGDVRIEKVPAPGRLRPDWVRLRVHLASLCGTDASQYKEATMIPLTHRHPVSNHLGPVILGHELVGTVIEKGSDVSQFEIGDRLVPGSGWWCGSCPQCSAGRTNICEQYYLFGIHAHGGLAEIADFPAKMCLRVPEQCTDEAATIAQPCAVALHALSRGNIQPDQTIALFGIGNIGSLLLALMQAQRTPLRSIVAIDVDASRLQTAKMLGADYLVDARSHNSLTFIQEVTGGRGVDLAIDATGLPETIALALSSVCRGGQLLQVGIPLKRVPLEIDSAVIQEKQIIPANGHICGVDLSHALELLSTTNLATQVGSTRISLKGLVHDGLLPLIENRARGKILVDVLHGGIL